VRFTCLLPVHAGDDAALFSQAFASVAANGLPPTAILVCQDGPLPPTLARAVADAGAEIVLNPGPKGLHHNLNHALTRVTTPWLCRADADDLNLPDRFERQAAFLADRPNVSVLGGAIAEIGPDGARHLKTMPLTHAAIARRAHWRNPINHMTAFMRAQAVRACGGYPAIDRKEDYGLWLAMLARGARLANLPDVLVEARVGAAFHARRAGLHNLASEYALYRLRHETPGAALVHLARAIALSSPTIARGAYLGVLRR
jgi:hypothetical protein